MYTNATESNMYVKYRQQNPYRTIQLHCLFGKLFLLQWNNASTETKRNQTKRMMYKKVFSLSLCIFLSVAMYERAIVKKQTYKININYMQSGLFYIVPVAQL